MSRARRAISPSSPLLSTEHRLTSKSTAAAAAACCVPSMAKPTIVPARPLRTAAAAAAAAVVQDDHILGRKEGRARQVDWNPLNNTISFARAFSHHWREGTINWPVSFNIVLVHTAAAVGVATASSCKWQTLLFACILAILGWVLLSGAAVLQVRGCSCALLGVLLFWGPNVCRFLTERPSS